MRRDTDQYLIDNGWIFVKKVKLTGPFMNSYASLWSHPDHQSTDPNGRERGFFTRSDALHHQKVVEKQGGCDCVPRRAPSLHG